MASFQGLLSSLFSLHREHARSSSHLAGNYLPVEECPPTPCAVQGDVPPSLRGGVYLRNGPNPRHNTDKGYHFLDGDGMIHAVKLHDSLNSASYCCRYVRTHKLKREQAAGHKLFVNVFGELRGLGAFAHICKAFLHHFRGSVDLSEGFGTANTGVFAFNNLVFATQEADMPYTIKVKQDGDLETIQRHDFGGKLRTPFAESPKLDPITGDMFAFCYRILFAPHFIFYRVSRTGALESMVPIKTDKVRMIHNIAITESFVVIPENQLTFDFTKLLTGGYPVQVNRQKPTRVAVLPKDAVDDSELRWFDVPNLMCMHHPNAWEEGDEIVLLGINYPMTAHETQVLLDMENAVGNLIQIRINLKSSRVSVQELTSVDGGETSCVTMDMNKLYTGRRNRYLYFVHGKWPRHEGICKLDLRPPGGMSSESSAAVVARKTFPEGCYPSEVNFVPRTGNSAEDDGYLICYLHNELQGTCELLIMDARSPSLETLAVVHLPQRVPFGFHGEFVHAHQLEN